MCFCNLFVPFIQRLLNFFSKSFPFFIPIFVLSVNWYFPFPCGLFIYLYIFGDCPFKISFPFICGKGLSFHLYSHIGNFFSWYLVYKLINNLLACISGLSWADSIWIFCQHVDHNVHATHQSEKPDTGETFFLSHEHWLSAHTFLHEAWWILQSV